MSQRSVSAPASDMHHDGADRAPKICQSDPRLRPRRRHRVRRRCSAGLERGVTRAVVNFADLLPTASLRAIDPAISISKPARCAIACCRWGDNARRSRHPSTPRVLATALMGDSIATNPFMLLGFAFPSAALIPLIRFDADEEGDRAQRRRDRDEQDGRSRGAGSRRMILPRVVSAARFKSAGTTPVKRTLDGGDRVSKCQNLAPYQTRLTPRALKISPMSHACALPTRWRRRARRHLTEALKRPSVQADGLQGRVRGRAGSIPDGEFARAKLEGAVRRRIPGSRCCSRRHCWRNATPSPAICGSANSAP